MKERLVLVVDDEGLVKEYLEEVMARYGYRCAAFTDPKEALIFFEMHSAKVDVVVADIRMPDITGYELAKELMKISPNTPVILISAYFPSLKAVQEAPNVKRVLSKPLSTKLLLEAIETEISESSQAM
ncbi:MAG: Chemotaxis protein CheY [Syntrophorhabdaceae bacterium PtaU1.Bin034]|jgi:two-component system NtrC family sensor kinase|nr:MAG: Chemotaxis protein CheY [Syntrophorhabdaceae bacterium PtaU1.Bin034]